MHACYLCAFFRQEVPRGRDTRANTKRDDGAPSPLLSQPPQRPPAPLPTRAAPPLQASWCASGVAAARCTVRRTTRRCGRTYSCSASRAAARRNPTRNPTRAGVVLVPSRRADLHGWLQRVELLRSVSPSVRSPRPPPAAPSAAPRRAGSLCGRASLSRPHPLARKTRVARRAGASAPTFSAFSALPGCLVSAHTQAPPGPPPPRCGRAGGRALWGSPRRCGCAVLWQEAEDAGDPVDYREGGFGATAGRRQYDSARKLDRQPIGMGYTAYDHV